MAIVLLVFMDTKTDAIALSRQMVGPFIRSDAQDSSPPTAENTWCYRSL